MCFDEADYRQYTDLLDLNTKVVTLQTLKILNFLNLLCFDRFSDCFLKPSDPLWLLYHKRIVVCNVS